MKTQAKRKRTRKQPTKVYNGKNMLFYNPAYEPDQKANKEKKVAKQEKAKQTKFDDLFEQMKAAVKAGEQTEVRYT